MFCNYKIKPNMCHFISRSIVDLFHQYRGEELPAQAEFDQDPEEQAATEQLGDGEQAANPDIGAVLHLRGTKEW